MTDEQYKAELEETKGDWATFNATNPGQFPTFRSWLQLILDKGSDSRAQAMARRWIKDNAS